VGFEPLPVCGWPTFPSVLWCCWLGLLTCKTVSRITYTVLVETLNPAQSNPIQSASIWRYDVNVSVNNEFIQWNFIHHLCLFCAGLADDAANRAWVKSISWLLGPIWRSLSTATWGVHCAACKTWRTKWQPLRHWLLYPPQQFVSHCAVCHAYKGPLHF